MRLLERAHTRPVAAVIAGVCAVEHDGIPVRSGGRADRAEDAALAEIAALCRIRGNGILAQNVQLQLAQRHTERRRQPPRIRTLKRRLKLRADKIRHDIRAARSGAVEYERRIRPARERERCLRMLRKKIREFHGASVSRDD